jgi:2-C-methyl-D-erythritol 4-phosphate cytidylyltransferase
MPGRGATTNGSGAASVCAVVLCAGQGTRMGADRNKVFLPLAGKPILIRSVEACLSTRGVTSVVLVAHPLEVAEVRALVRQHALPGIRDVVAGGATRHQSEYAALNALRASVDAGALDVVLIHDAARPLVRPADIARLIRAARRDGGALLATSADPAEMLARASADGSVATLYRAAEVWHAQTPQAGPARTLLWAYDEAARVGYEGTDTASALERVGMTVRVVRGSADNIKITTPLDLARAEALLARSTRSGAGVRQPPSRQ